MNAPVRFGRFAHSLSPIRCTERLHIDTSSFADPSNDLRSRRGGLWLTLLCIASVGVIVCFSLWNTEGQVAPPRMLDSVWAAPGGDRSHLYFVMEEERWERRFPSYVRRDYWFTVNYSVFTLRSVDAQDGRPSGTVELARIDNAVSGQGPEILGPQGDVLWLWNGGLEARDLRTLNPVWTMKMLLELNPEFATLVPTEREYFKVLGKLNSIVIKGNDAQFLLVDSATGKIRRLDDATLGSYIDSKRANDAFTYLRSESDSLWSTSISGLMWNSLVVGQTWYALLTADERAGLVDEPGNGMAPGGEVARTLYRAHFEWDYHKLLGTNEIKLDPAAVTEVSPERFLMGGFLRRPNANTLWSVEDGKSFLVLHRKALGSGSPWFITLLGLDGKVRWTRSTELADPKHLSWGPGTVVLTGFADSSQPTRNRPDLVVFIDERSGRGRRLNLVSSEVVELP